MIAAANKENMAIRYSDAEMLFFNSLIDGREIFGLNLKKPKVMDAAFVLQTIFSLKEKNLINPDGTLVEVHPNPIVMLEYYKHARKFVFFNNVHIALCDNKEMVAVNVTDEGYDIFSGNTWRYLYGLFMYTPLFNQRNAVELRESMHISAAEYVAALADPAYPNNLIMRKYADRELSNEITLLWNESTILYIDSKSHTKRMMNGFEARIALVDFFEITEGYDSEPQAEEAGAQEQ